tara:strand:- start:116761 stop:117924 length:1164 start_codon:yes stop_codon:yes gene_type:complete
MTAEGVEKTEEKKYDQSAIALRVVRNVLISQMMTIEGGAKGLDESIVFGPSSKAMQSIIPQKFGQSVHLWQQTAQYVQLLCDVLDLLEPLDHNEKLKLLPDEQNQSVKQLYEYCLNQSNHPDELDKLKKQIIAVNTCLYKNEGTLVNWSSASSLCGQIRQRLSTLSAKPLEMKYSMMVTTAQSYLTRQALSEQDQDISELFGALSISKTVNGSAEYPEPPPPPPVYTMSFLQATKPTVADDSSLVVSSQSTASQVQKRHSSAMILAKQQEMAAARRERIRLAKQAREKQTDDGQLEARSASTISDGDMENDIESQVTACRELTLKRLAAEQKKILQQNFGGSKFLSLAGMHGDSGSDRSSDSDADDGVDDGWDVQNTCDTKKSPAFN